METSSPTLRTTAMPSASPLKLEWICPLPSNNQRQPSNSFRTSRFGMLPIRLIVFESTSVNALIEEIAMYQNSLSLIKERRTERGAALVTTLMLSALLFAAGGMLILTTTMTGLNTIDSAAESQAYYGAEAGLQASLNVLRGHVMPNPLFAANPAGGV